MAHTIRLRGPWFLHHPNLDDPLRFRAPGKAPTDSIPRQENGPPDSEATAQGHSVELIRTFNRPTGLDVTSKVFLCGTIKTGRLDISVNQILLAEELTPVNDEAVDFQVDLTALLQPSNEVTLRCDVIKREIEIVEVWLKIE